MPQPIPRDADILEEVERLLSGSIHTGDRARSSREAIGKPLALRLATAGFVSLATRLDGWLAESTAVEPNAFYDTAIWLLALKESGETAQ